MLKLADVCVRRRILAKAQKCIYNMCVLSCVIAFESVCVNANEACLAVIPEARVRVC